MSSPTTTSIVWTNIWIFLTNIMRKYVPEVSQRSWTTCRAIVVWLYLRHVFTWYMLAESFVLGQTLWYFDFGIVYCFVGILIRLVCQLISSFVTSLEQRLFFVTLRCIVIWFGISHVIIQNANQSGRIPPLLLFTTVVPGVFAVVRRFGVLGTEQPSQPVMIANHMRYVLADQARFSLCITIVFFMLMIVQAYLPIGILFAWAGHTWAWYFIHSEISSYVTLTHAANQAFLQTFMSAYFNQNQQDQEHTPLGELADNLASSCILGQQAPYLLLANHAYDWDNDTKNIPAQHTNISSGSDTDTDYEAKEYYERLRRKSNPYPDDQDDSTENDYAHTMLSLFSARTKKTHNGYDSYEDDYAFYTNGHSSLSTIQ